MLNKIKWYINFDCQIFTIMTLVLNFMYIIVGEVDDINLFGYIQLTLQHFTLSTVITILFFLFKKIIAMREWYSYLTTWLIVLVSVYGIGSLLFDWFDINSWWSLITLAITIFIYVVIFLLNYIENIKDSKNINEKLNEMRERNSE
ncbi:MAG: DUF3021 family protein [Ruminococcus sp.]|nr:DUF3021 family protein [Ruminococcus sp.]